MSNANREAPQPFDEDAVLRDLEHLRGQILEARSQREKKAAEFDKFVKESREASQAERLRAVENLESTTRALNAARTADRATGAALTPALVASAPRMQPQPALPTVEDDGTPVSRRVVIPRSRFDRKRFDIAALLSGRSRLRLGIAAGSLVAVLAMVMYYGLSGSDSASTQQPPQQSPATLPAPPQVATPAAAPPQPAPKPDPRPIQIQLEAIRPVWMQVVVDGQREIGRTVPQGQRLSFGANNEIALRAGDAGAVRVYVAGVDRGVLGRDGQVVNRRFTK